MGEAGAVREKDTMTVSCGRRPNSVLLQCRGRADRPRHLQEAQDLSHTVTACPSHREEDIPIILRGPLLSQPALLLDALYDTAHGRTGHTHDFRTLSNRDTRIVLEIEQGGGLRRRRIKRDNSARYSRKSCKLTCQVTPGDDHRYGRIRAGLMALCCLRS